METLGRVTHVVLVLWGSMANPQTCKLQTSLAPSRDDGWQTIETIDVPSQFARAHTHTLQRPVDSRYWRLVVRSNWGATWGVGLQRVRFLGDVRSRAAAAAQEGLLQLSHFEGSGAQRKGTAAAKGRSTHAAAVAAVAGSAAVLVVWAMWSRLGQWWTPWATSRYAPVPVPSTPGTRVFVRRVRTGAGGNPNSGGFEPHGAL